MFKFKMLTKVLVAVFFYGQIIELNLNLCIAHSIGLANPERQSGSPHAAWQLRDPLASSDDFQSMAPDDRQRVMLAPPPFASRTLLESASEGAEARGPSAPSSSQTKTTLEGDEAAGAQKQVVPVSEERRELRVSPTEEQERQLIELAASDENQNENQNENEIANQEDQSKLEQDEQDEQEGPRQILESNGRLNYFGRVFLGESRTPFMVLFDLSSSGLWLPSSECKSPECISRLKFNASASPSYEPLEPGRSFNLTLDTKMELLGHWGKELVEFAGVPLASQHFGEVEEIRNGDLMTYLPVDGFLGLGFKRHLASPKEGQEVALTPFERLWASGKLREPIFSLLLRKDVEEYKYSADNGELVLGQLARGYQASELTYVPVTHVDYWEFHLGGVSFRQTLGDVELETACQSACPAILDTRHAFIAGHQTDVDRLNTAIGGRHVGGGLYRLAQCDLSLLPYLVLNIGGTEFNLAPEEYVTVKHVRGQVRACYSDLVVVQADQYPFWILGERFLKRHYVVFDYGQRRIGFARSKNMTQELEEDIYGRLRRKRPELLIAGAR